MVLNQLNADNSARGHAILPRLPYWDKLQDELYHLAK